MSGPARIAFHFDGRALSARDGDTIAAALAAAGIAACGRRRDASPRGFWCGMGVCQECLVVVDGVPSVRACMTKAADGSRVASQGYAAALPPIATTPPVSSPTTQSPQVLVVGAGPAGLAAARAAALCGAEVLMADERARAGGQYFKQLAVKGDFATSADAQQEQGRVLIDEVERLGVTIVRDAVVWGEFGGRSLAATVRGAPQVFAPQRLVLATGAYERGVSLPGWTLPGFVTTGAAQTLLRAHRVAPGKRVLVAGNGPLNLQLAVELVEAGVDVVALVEAAPAPRLRDAATILHAARFAPALMREGLRYRARLRLAGVPILHRSSVIAAHGAKRVDGCDVARIDGSGVPLAASVRRFDVDTVCVGYGFLPSNALARALGCRHAHDARFGELATVVDANGATSIDNVYAIGDGVRLLGARVALCQGFVTGCAVARSLGLPLPAAAASELAEANRELRRHLRFQAALWHLFAAPRLDLQFCAADTLVCRCENVTRGALDRALDDGATSAGALKRRTRAGMGRCQGRYCEPLILAMLAQRGAAARDEAARFAPRMPMTPIRVGTLADPSAS
jgi:NADPH-dependent 2,4-dienoyl-CoA reductase/sulfur reductase-like enzyme